MTIVLGSVLYLSNQTQARQDFESEKLSVQQNANEALDQMYRDLRMAGYPQSRSVCQPAWGGLTGNSSKVASGFTTINSSNVVFQGDIDNDGIVEVVEYRLNGTTLERSEVEKNSDGTIPTASYQSLAPNVTSLSFTYYRLEWGYLDDDRCHCGQYLAGRCFIDDSDRHPGSAVQTIPNGDFPNECDCPKPGMKIREEIGHGVMRDHE